MADVNPCKKCGEIPLGYKTHWAKNIRVVCDNHCEKFDTQPVIEWYGSEQKAIDVWNGENPLLHVQPVKGSGDGN